MTIKNISKYLLIFILTFSFLLISKKYKGKIFNQFSYIINITKINFKNRNFQQCNIKSINFIPQNSIIIIGHAYGSSSNNKNQFISTKIKSLLDKNLSSIDILFLTGDVFEISTIEKWEKLYQNYKNHFKIFIAPGNHDYALRDIKKNNIINTQYLNYPFFIKKDNLNFILEDSFTQKWQLNNNIILYLNQSKGNYENIILRHNIANDEFLDLANSTEGLSSDLPLLKDLSKKINKKLIIISGDTGASYKLPSFYCKEFRNIKVIANGIGNFKKDTILIISEQRLFKYKI